MVTESEHTTASSSPAQAITHASEHALPLLVRDIRHITRGRTTINCLSHHRSSLESKRAFQPHQDPTSHSTSNLAMTSTLLASPLLPTTKKMLFPCIHLTCALHREHHLHLPEIVSQMTARSERPRLQMTAQTSSSI